MGTPLITRLVSAVVAIALIGATLLPGATPRAHAHEEKADLFRAEFDSAPLGPLSGPLAVEFGTVVPQGNVAIAAASGGPALALDATSAQATALMQWVNFPGALPLHAGAEDEELRLDVEALFTTSISSTAGASFGLLSGASFFEFFTFGPNGALTRAGAPIGLHYTPGIPVLLRARIDLEEQSGRVRITLITAGGETTFTVVLDGAFSTATLNQLRFQAPAASGITTADHVRVRLRGEDEDDHPPAIIIIDDDDIVQEIEHIGGIIFVNITIAIVNTGGMARGAVLVLNLDDLDEFFELADVSFLEGIGFVQELNDRQVLIGLGQNNIVDHNGKIKVKIKFKAKGSRVDIKINAHFRLRFSDGSGDHDMALPPVVIVVPVVVVPVLVVQRLPLSAIDARFAGFWRSRGGLIIFGLPLTQPITLPNGVVVQYFERARLEWHPELAGTPFEILLGLLAVELGYATPPIATVPTDAGELTWYFPATGHLIGRPFRAFWRAQGGLAIFGLPIGEAVMENGLLVQYFERARMELHPDLAGTPFEVQLGHLGVEALEAGVAQP